MAIDRVKPLKMEGPGSGGTETDDFPTSADPSEDFLDCRGISIQYPAGGTPPHTNDETVLVSRDVSGNMTFTDSIVGAVKTLTDLLATGTGMTEAAHKIIRHIIHYIEEGPAENSYKKTTWTGILPASEIWYTTSGMTAFIYEKNYTWTGITATTIERKIYDTDGSTVLATATDTITYNGIFEDTSTRVVT